MEAKDGVCPGMECSLKKLDGAILILKNLHKHQLHDPVDFGWYGTKAIALVVEV